VEVQHIRREGVERLDIRCGRTATTCIWRGTSRQRSRVHMVSHVTTRHWAAIYLCLMLSLLLPVFLFLRLKRPRGKNALPQVRPTSTTPCHLLGRYRTRGAKTQMPTRAARMTHLTSPHSSVPSQLHEPLMPVRDPKSTPSSHKSAPLHSHLALAHSSATRAHPGRCRSSPGLLGQAPQQPNQDINPATTVPNHQTLKYSPAPPLSLPSPSCLPTTPFLTTSLPSTSSPPATPETEPPNHRLPNLELALLRPCHRKEEWEI